MESTKFTISAVHRLTGKARSTIGNHIKSGKVSVIEDDDDTKFISASEVVRVYGDVLELDENGKLKQKIKTNKLQSDESTSQEDVWESLFHREKDERERERALFKETIAHLRDDLEKSQEREGRTSLLLESHASNSDTWKLQISKIEDRISNQETEIKKYRKALHDERNKSIWEKLFG